MAGGYRRKGTKRKNKIHHKTYKTRNYRRDVD